MHSLKYQPLISVVVPVYNICNYVRKCIESIIAQTYKRLEIILIDDGSTDGSETICDEYAERDSRIIVSHSTNAGQVHARRIGTELSSGNYIFYIDGDDWIEKERILSAVECLQEEKFDMLYMGGYFQDFFEQSVLIRDEFTEESFWGEKMRDIFSMLQAPECAFKRNFRGLLWQWGIKRDLCLNTMLVDDSISMGEDLLGIWMCVLCANSVHAFINPTYHYVQRTKSLTYTYDSREEVRMEHFKNALIKSIEASAYKNDPFVMKCAIMACFSVIAISDFSLLMRGSSDYLFPYKSVIHGSKVIVYGAGKLGFHICNAIKKCDKYDIVMVCDRNVSRPPVCGYIVQPLSAIQNANYDFIIIAAIYEQMAIEMKSTLLSIGVSKEKIALMDPSVLTAENLERVFSKSDLAM